MPEITARKVLLTSFAVDLLDIVTNVVVAIITGSAVMVAETLQGAADLTAVSFLLIGISRASRPANFKYPFGRGRELYFWTLLASIIMLAVTATLSFYLGFQRYLEPQPIPSLFLAIGVLIFSIFTNGYALSLDIRRLSHNSSKRLILRHFLSSPHIETKTTFVLDLLGTSAAVFGLISLVLFRLSGNQRFDGIGAMGIGIVLALFSLILIFGVRELLIGLTAPRKTRRQIRQIALNFPQVAGIGDLKTIYTGSNQLLVHLDLHFRNNLTTDQIEDAVTRIKQEIKRELPVVNDVQIELTSY